jgi:tetratricopeptide (TPR) repeat protein
MKSRETIDGAHTSFTDHQIRIPSSAQASAAKSSDVLVPWRAPESQFAARNLALAYLSGGERKRSSEMIKRAFPLLVQAQKQFPKDPDITAGLALELYLKGLNRQAADAFELAIQLRPDVRFDRDASAAWNAAGNFENAIRDLNRAIQADPSDENAYRMLADILHANGSRSSEMQVLDRYLLFRPASIEFRQRRSALNAAAR